MNTFTACYDLAVSPPTYDFFPFLAQAERARLAMGRERIDLVIQPGLKDGFRDDGLPPDLIERRSMLLRVVLAGARLLPSVSDVVCFGQRTNISCDFPARYDVMRPTSHYGAFALKNGHRCLRATEAAKRAIKRRFDGMRFATITLRQSAYWPGRNSNLKAWTAAADYLKEYNITPVFVPDTHGVAPHGYASAELASWDIDLRMAIYEAAEVNLGVANGPLALCILSNAKYVMWKLVSNDAAPAHKVEFYRSHGIEVGDQFGENGRLIWEDDSTESVIKGVHEFLHGQADMHEADALAANG